MLRLYTRQGDGGTSALLEGVRHPKHAAIFCVIGELDELNAQLGVCVTHADAERQTQLHTIQSSLFAIGAQLASTGAEFGVTTKQTKQLEDWIDADWNRLPPLTQFVLPGGSPLGAQLHLARAVTRRAERALSKLHEQLPVNDTAMTFVNRLSDYLFAAARAENVRARQPERRWHYEP